MFMLGPRSYRCTFDVVARPERAWPTAPPKASTGTPNAMSGIPPIEGVWSGTSSRDLRCH